MTSLILTYLFLFLAAGAIGFGAGWLLRATALRTRHAALLADAEDARRQLAAAQARAAAPPRA